MCEANTIETNTVPKIGIALSGGGVRGLAHLGVLQVLEQAEVPVHLIAGTSMGGLVAGMYAAGVPLQDLFAFAKTAGLMDLASPDRMWRGLFGHNKMARILADLLGSPDLTFDDLNIPLAVVATDLETGQAIVLDRGLVIPALLATSAVPLMFAPVQHQGRWLVDGGLVNNLPVDIVRQMGVERVLAVSTPPSVRLDPEREPERNVLPPRGLYLPNHRTRDWKLPFLIAETSVGIAVQAANHERIATYPPDLLIEISLPNIGLFSGNGNQAIIENGREAALEHLEELERLKETPISDQSTVHLYQGQKLSRTMQCSSWAR